MDRGLILVNPHSGRDETAVDELRRHFPDADVEECRPSELLDRVASAVDASVGFVGIAGGDGTIGAAAAKLIGTDVPLLPIPAGTRNHFARDLGVSDLDAAGRAAHGRRRAVDVGRVNGCVFVNNSSIGLYPKIVVRREFHQRRVRKPVANVIAVYEQLRRGRRLTVELDGETYLSWIVFVGNGNYGEGLLDLADRETLDDNVLDVRVVRADRPLSRLRVLGAILLGRLARSPLVITLTTSRITIGLRRSVVEVAVDGEVRKLEPPLRYESIAGGLTVLVPPED